MYKYILRERGKRKKKKKKKIPLFPRVWKCNEIFPRESPISIRDHRFSILSEHRCYLFCIFIKIITVHRSSSRYNIFPLFFSSCSSLSKRSFDYRFIFLTFKTILHHIIPYRIKFTNVNETSGEVTKFFVLDSNGFP